MAKPTGSAFDALLETFGTDEDRAQFQSLAERNPAVKQFGLRQDDYSRKLDAHDAELKELQGWREWREGNWDSTHKMTKAEKAKQDRLEALETEKAELETKMAAMEIGGSDMTFEDVERIATEAMKKNGIDPNKFVPKADLDERFKEGEMYVRNLNAYTADAALLVPYLNAQHQKEFGEMFNPKDFLKAATEAKTTDLEAFYQTFTADTRMKRMQADADARVKAAQDERDAAVAAERQKTTDIAERMKGMGSPNANPADSEGSTMGPLQRKMLGLDKPKDGSSGAPEVPLGEGGVANYAAREFINKQAGR